MQTIRIEDMNWPDIKGVMASGYTSVIFAIGSNEQHGPHLPTKTDSYFGDKVVNDVAKRLGKTLQAPTINVGCSDHHLTFPGTISYRSSTLKAILHDYVTSLIKHGFETIILIPSHGGNFRTTQEAIEELRPQYPNHNIIGYTDLFGLLDIMAQLSSEFNVSKQESGAHAGETETALMLALAEDLIKKDRFTPGYLGNIGEEETQLIFEKGMPALTQNGILGDPTKATKEHGEIYLTKIAEFLVNEIQKQL